MSEPDDIEAQRALAAAMFPREWASASSVPGKRGGRMRAGLRKRAVAETIMAPIRAAGGMCGNCASRIRNPGMMKGLFCELGSGGGAYQTTAPDSLCAEYEGPAKTRAAA